MNCVRKHLSAIKGGRLAAAAAPARVVTLAISDVPGDDPAVIGSGPTVPDPTTFAEARALLARYRITPSPAVAARLAQDADETPKPGSLPNAELHLIATPAMALAAAAETARGLGLAPLILGDALEGESREMGAGHGRHRPLRSRPTRLPLRRPGAAAVGRRDHGDDRPGAGRPRRPQHRIPARPGGRPGGRARHLGASPATPTASTAPRTLPAPSSRPDTLARARAAGLDPRAVLDGHDSYSLFDAIGDLIRTGPTLTNVNDVRAVLVA